MSLEITANAVGHVKNRLKLLQRGYLTVITTSGREKKLLRYYEEFQARESALRPCMYQSTLRPICCMMNRSSLAAHVEYRIVAALRPVDV